MLTRIWRTGFDVDRLADLQRFAETVSADMFRDLPGCLGHLYAVDGSIWITQTFWTSAEAIELAEASDLYRSVVARILAEGFLSGEPKTEVFEVTSLAPVGWLEQ